MTRLAFTIILFVGVFSQSIVAKQPWHQWVQGVRREAIAEGISPDFFDSVFKNIKIGQKQVHLDRTQPERRLTFLQYRKTRISPYRIALGKRKFQKYEPMLTAISHDYGVDPCVVTAIWGLETSYGHFMGSFSVIQSLATLAYDGRRSEFFRKELLLALKIVYDGHIELDKFKGEWAGASGHGQFLPSSWYNYAVDHDRDGTKDIWTTIGDGLASIANYLHKNDWEANQPWGMQVELAHSVPNNMIGLKFNQSVAKWEAMGVQPVHALPKNLNASLVAPYGGPNFLVFHNFRVIGTYNPSLFYGLSVGYLANRICE